MARGWAFLISFLMAALILSPTPASATHTTVALPECTADVPGACSATFELSVDVYTYVDHADFHELLVDGDITLDWYDALGIQVRTWTCLGTSVNSTNANDIMDVCSVRNHSSFYYAGTQTLKVSALAYTNLCSDACTFHGRVRFYT